jgi:hypothetical protein
MQCISSFDVLSSKDVMALGHQTSQEEILEFYDFNLLNFLMIRKAGLIPEITVICFDFKPNCAISFE